MRLDLETTDPAEMLVFLMGPLGNSDSLRSAVEGETLNLEALGTRPSALLAASAEDGVITRQELVDAVTADYYRAAGVPETRADLLALLDTTSSLQHEVSGSMTRFRRRMHIARNAVREALERRLVDGQPMTYSPGTVVIGEHLDEGQIPETTAMIRRDDGFWTFVAYDADGNLTRSIEGDPDPLHVPADCFGCHYGTRPYEPERSFPAEARPGPYGPRAVHVGPELRRADVTTLLNEHARRDDGLLGLYGTLYLSALKSGTLAPADSLDRTFVQALPGS